MALPGCCKPNVSSKLYAYLRTEALMQEVAMRVLKKNNWSAVLLLASVVVVIVLKLYQLFNS